MAAKMCTDDDVDADALCKLISAAARAASYDMYKDDLLVMLPLTCLKLPEGPPPEYWAIELYNTECHHDPADKDAHTKAPEHAGAVLITYLVDGSMSALGAAADVIHSIFSIHSHKTCPFSFALVKHDDGIEMLPMTESACRRARGDEPHVPGGCEGGWLFRHPENVPLNPDVRRVRLRTSQLQAQYPYFDRLMELQMMKFRDMAVEAELIARR